MNDYHGLGHGKNNDKVHIQICAFIVLLYYNVLFSVLYAV
jgi:hypothetical protein